MNRQSANPTAHWWTATRIAFLRVAAGGAVPARWVEDRLPPIERRAARSGNLSLEIVSHCWNYAHFLVYQLSSLALFPPTRGSVTMTVFYSPEDAKTAALLEHFGALTIPSVRWNWQPLPRAELFRRGIGRNRAALATKADWVWFTDCDLMFREGCLDTLVERLQGRRDALVYPHEERRTAMLASENPMLREGQSAPRVLDVDAREFTAQHPSRAIGPLQIAHGDVCRAVGYCDALAAYQTPAEHWCKAHEDRAFRWLLRTQGVPIDVPGVYRIRHVEKGRYTGSRLNTGLRSWLRQAQAQRRERRRQNHEPKQH